MLTTQLLTPEEVEEMRTQIQQRAQARYESDLGALQAELQQAHNALTQVCLCASPVLKKTPFE